MLLVVDVGNTQTVLGLYDEVSGDAGSATAGLVEHWRVATVSERTADEYAVMLHGLLAIHGFRLADDIDGVAISSGVPRATSALRDLATHTLDQDPVVLGPGVKTGMAVLYENPKDVGADRIANAVGAYDLYGGPTVVCDFGTGTTFDVISADGAYLGGAISPGVEISLDALFGRAAALRAVEMVEPRSVIGRTTAESLQSGTIYGTAAHVDGMCARISDELGEITVIATGGLASLIAPYSRRIEQVEPWLTLHGLRLVYRKNLE